MNEETKLLLMSYVDGELNEAESIVAEDIINTDTEALDFVNKLKQANIQIDAFYESQENEEIENELYQFLENDILERKYQQLSFFEKIFSFRPVLNYSLTALFFLSIGIFYDDYSSELNFASNISEELLKESSMPLGLGSEIYLNEIFKTRGLNDIEANSMKDYIKQTLIKMLDENTSSGILKYGTDNVKILLEAKTIEENDLNCYLGNIFINEIESKILFCSSKDDNSLTFFN
jgi:hypothetical protein